MRQASMVVATERTVEQQLRTLICAVQQCQDGNYGRRKALDRLLQVIQRLPGILRSSHPNYPDALNLTWSWLSRTIDRFDPSPPRVPERLISWINGYLRWRIRDLYIPDHRYPISLDQPLRPENEDGVTLLDQLPDPRYPLTLSLLDLHILQLQRQEDQQLEIEVSTYIEQDPDQILRQCHPRRYPDCHCQVLAQRLLLKEPPDRLKQVADEFMINYQTLNSHWKLRCLPLLQSICRNFGYQSWSA